MEAEASLKPQRQMEYRTPTAGLPRVYSNNVQLATTSFDVRIIFGEVVDVLPEKVVVEQNVQVTMSWAEAKIVADFLQANIKTFESLNGPIELPKTLDKIIVTETFPLPK